MVEHLKQKGHSLFNNFAIAISVALLLGIEQLRKSMRNSFLQTVFGIDLVVGARGDAIPILLYSVFRLGEATNNLRWRSYLEWTIPYHSEIPIKGIEFWAPLQTIGNTTNTVIIVK